MELVHGRVSSGFPSVPLDALGEQTGKGDRVGDSQSSEAAPTGASERPGPPLQLDHGTPEGRELALLGAQHMARLRKHALREPLTSPLLHHRSFGS